MIAIDLEGLPGEKEKRIEYRRNVERKEREPLSDEHSSSSSESQLVSVNTVTQ